MINIIKKSYFDITIKHFLKIKKKYNNNIIIII